MVERSVYRCNNPHLPVHELVIDPFESPYRPTQRVKTQDRVATTPESINNSSTAINDTQIVSEILVEPQKPQLQFPVSLKDLSQDYEIDLLKTALANCQYNQKKTADALELTYHQLRGYLKKYNLLDGSGADE